MLFTGNPQPNQEKSTSTEQHLIGVYVSEYLNFKHSNNCSVGFC